MKIINHITKIAEDLGLETQNKSEQAISIWTSQYLGISLLFECDEEENLNFYFSQRTSSWFYNGERTDLHDVIPIIFALFLKRLNICSLYFTDVYNPATYADAEIYSKYLTPFQINSDFSNKKSEKYLKFIDELITSLMAFENFFWACFPGCPCENCRKKLGYKFEYSWEIEEKRLETVMTSVNSSREQVNYCERTLPNWFYFRDFKKKVSLIQSQDLYPFIESLSKNSKAISLNSISGKLYIEEQCHHYLGNFKSREIKATFKKLGDKQKSIVFLENRIIAIGDQFILCFNYDCGDHKFQDEKSKLKIRHEKEYKILFKPSKLEWNEKIDDSRFEDLIKDLLEREPEVLRVRKTAHTRERDGGVDLIVDWKIPKTQMYTGDINPYQTLKIIVQCKAYKDGVSKSKVTDIRDTIEYRNYDGYFLVVSSYLTKSLSDYLDKLRTENKFWIEWWSRDEIEKRLIQHQDLILKFSDIVKVKE